MLELKISAEIQRYRSQISGKEPIEGDKFIQGEPEWYIYNFPNTWKELWIIPISDCHRGNPQFSEHHFVRTIREIYKHPYVFTILNGDLCESATRTSLGDIYKQIGTAQEQKDWMIERLMPIKKKVLGITMGNHEDRIYQQSGIDICLDIAKALNVPYRPEGIGITICFGSGCGGHKDRPYIYDIYATHGYGGARTRGGKLAKIERSANHVHADVYLMSHDHEVNVANSTYLMRGMLHRKQMTGSVGELTVAKAVAHEKKLVKTNAYLKWGGYAEFKGFSPTSLETPIIKFLGQGKSKVKVES